MPARSQAPSARPAARAVWKGTFQLAEVSLAVSLHAAASTAERVAFHLLNRKTGHRVARDFVDSQTGQPVGKDDTVKGYEIQPDQFVVFSESDLAAALPEADKTLKVQAILPCAAVDTVYFDRPYHMAPADPAAGEGFALLVEGLRRQSAAALARTVLFRRLRTVLIRPDPMAGDPGLVATTLHFADEIRPAAAVFADLAEVKLEDEMLDLAKHIIATKTGRFDPASFDDRYEAALADLIRAKIEGRAIKPRPEPIPSRREDLLAALRDSLGQGAPKKPAPRGKTAKDSPAPPPKRRKAG